MICRYLVTSTAFSDCIALRFRVGEVELINNKEL